MSIWEYKIFSVIVSLLALVIIIVDYFHGNAVEIDLLWIIISIYLLLIVIKWGIVDALKFIIRRLNINKLK